MKKKKYKIGYTTGVFDLFHVGHLNILKKAKSYCDFLIVGVSTDENVANYKGRTPIVCFKDRYSIIKSIKYVDKAIPQKDMDKIKVWNKFHYDAYFHGDDWKSTKLFNQYENEFKKRNIEMVYIKHTKGVSTTNLIKKIHEK